MSGKHQIDNSPQKSPYVDKRQAIEVLRSRISLLDGRDRLIMKMYYDKGASTTEIAALMRVSTSTVSRRIKTLSRRLVGHKYQNFTRNRHRLDPEEFEIARDHFIRGMSLRSIAAERDCSFYRIREILRRIKLLADCSAKTSPAAPASQSQMDNSENAE